MARRWRVSPDVGSMIVPPGFKRPARSAASIIRRPMRSLTLPPGFSISSLARIVGLTPAVTLRRRTSGVPPIASRKLSRYLMSEGLSCSPDLRLGQLQAEDSARVAEVDPAVRCGFHGQHAAPVVEDHGLGGDV